MALPLLFQLSANTVWLKLAARLEKTDWSLCLPACSSHGNGTSRGCSMLGLGCQDLNDTHSQEWLNVRGEAWAPPLCFVLPMQTRVLAVLALMENSLQNLQPATNQAGIHLACFFFLSVFLSFFFFLLCFKGKALSEGCGAWQEKVKNEWKIDGARQVQNSN